MKYPKIIRDFEQQSEEWFNLRSKKLTASNAQAIASMGKGLKTYIDKKLLNLVVKQDQFSNEHTERGNELEPIAREAYQFEKSVKVFEVAFIDCGEHVGFSPDGLIFKNNIYSENIEDIRGGCEIKARADKEHFRLLRGGKVDSKTVWQIQMSMLLTRADYWDFCSFNPNFRKSLLIIRFKPDAAKFQEIREGLSMGVGLFKKALEEDAIKYELNG